MTIPTMGIDTRAEADQSPPLRISGQASPLRAAKSPLGAGPVTVVGLILAVLVVALGLTGLHDAVIAAGAGTGGPWLDAVIRPFHALKAAIWVLPVGIVLILLGLWLLLTALRPRPRTAIALRAETGVFLRPRDVAKLARNAAQEVDGVRSIRATASRRKVVVIAQASTADGLEQKITQTVSTALQALAKAPTLRVSVKTDRDWS